MDRRRFLVQGIAASSVCALPLSVFASGGLAGHISVRPGKINDSEFKRALKEAKSKKMGLLLHPKSEVILTESHIVEVSLVGSGASVDVTKGELIFKNSLKSSQIVTGLNIKGQVKFLDSQDQIVSQNVFKENKGHAVIVANSVNFVFESNSVHVKNGNALMLTGDMESKIVENHIEVTGTGHFTWMQETMKGTVKGNIFKNTSKQSGPTLVVMNTGDLNPQMILKDNNLV